MSSQLVSDVRCDTLMHYAASYGERGSNNYKLTRRQTYEYHRIEKNSISPEEGNFKEHNNNEKSAKRSTNYQARQQAQKLHRTYIAFLCQNGIGWMQKLGT
uniref:Uncharacterized protein LOC101498814 isoform X2 n=1 Tax=Cicer arietinum TaxID=3827 RepID=A0A1S2YZG2_CICAR|nr:uncharacterized protein LOC101498814 isoform X2 [Cicer arietinum]